MLAGTGSRPRPFAPDKILGHKDRVQEWMRTGRSRPVTYELDMTNVCNHRCPGCFGFYPERDAAAMSLERAQSVILQIRDLGGRGLTFTGGGDPLVNPATPGAVEYAAGLGLDVGFITNAQSLPPALADLLLRSCVWVRVSLDAATPETYAVVRRGGNWRQLMKNLGFLAKLRRGNKFSHIQFNLLVQQRNFREMPLFIKRFLGTMCDSIQFSFLNNWGTWESKEQYERQCIWKQTHPEFQDFLRVLGDPIFNSPGVRLGNIFEYRKLALHQTAPRRALPRAGPAI